MNMPPEVFVPAEEQIRSLFGPFTDSASELRVTAESATTIRVEGQRRFRSFRLLLEPSANGELLVLSPARGQGGSLQVLISGPQFADLDALARSVIPFLKARLGEAGHVVDTRVMVEAQDGAESQIPASQAIAKSLMPGEAATQLTFLHGHAGAGKSWMLMKAALSQTHEFLTRRTRRLDLYIDAQGVNLRSLEQQIARQLDIYNGVLRFPEVIPLARLGVLGLIIDGFDELITPSGTNDTLRALYRYLADFEGQGAVLASARTSFFYLRDLESAHVAPDALVSVSTLEVQPWGETEWRHYCELRGQASQMDLLLALAAASEVNTALLGRPFVVAEILKVADARGGQVPPGGLLAVIEESFADRERLQKLVDPDRRDPQTRQPLPILSADQFDALLLAVADEMWRLRQNTLDVETLKTLAAMWAEEWHLGREYKNILIDRIDANAFLEPVPEGGVERRVQFPHEVVFARTLARLLANTLVRAQKDVISLLRMAPISRTVAEQFADIASAPLRGAGASMKWSAERVLELISETSRLVQWRSDDDANARLGVATVACELLRVAGEKVAGMEFLHLHFSKVSFLGTKLGTRRFRRCVFEDIDARGADWAEVSFEECDPIYTMKVSADQRFPESLPPVHHVVMHRKGNPPQEIFGTTPCRRALFEDLGSPKMPPQELSQRAQDVVRVTESLARRVQRVFWFAIDPEPTDDGFMTRLKGGAGWEDTIALLGRYGLIEASVRSRSGVRARLFHLKNPAQLLEQRDSADRQPGNPIAAYWDAVERLE
jgi:hypothetical protein